MAEHQPLTIENYRKPLTDLRSQLETDLEAYRLRAVNLGGGPDEPGSGQHWERSGYGDHLGDDATEVFEREKAIGLEQSLDTRLKQVEHALARLDAGKYGTCERCERPIAKERLDAMPEATLCIDCKSELEEQTPATRRRERGTII
jgi:RNA polymerase-binding transcription factor DksA